MKPNDVGNNAKTTDKQLGGITGKGFMPGQSGNPSGRPRKLPITERYEALADVKLSKEARDKLRLPPEVKRRIKTYGDLLAWAQFQSGFKGKTDAVREIADRPEGRARQAVEVSGPEGKPIDVTLMSEQQLDARINELLAILQREKQK